MNIHNGSAACSLYDHLYAFKVLSLPGVFFFFKKQVSFSPFGLLLLYKMMQLPGVALALNPFCINRFIHRGGRGREREGVSTGELFKK